MLSADRIGTFPDGELRGTDPRSTAGRRSWRLGRTGCLAVAFALAAGCGPERVGRPHTILLVTLDTTRADHVGIYGYGRATTPTIDSLARTGAYFASAISPMPTTDPAHLSMLTGLYPRSHGVRENGVRLPDPEIPNLVDWARSDGYQTAAFVSRKHLFPSDLSLSGFDFEDGPEGRERAGGETVDRALDWARSSAGDRPLFLWLHLFDPHAPYEPPPPYDSRFAPAGAAASSVVRPSADRSERTYSDEEISALVSLYDGEIAYADALVNRFLEGLAALRPGADEALVVLVGDHGEAMGELEQRFRYAFDHGNFLYQGLLHVPFIIRWPGRIPEGGIVDGPVELVDLPPTLFELLGVDGFSTQGTSRAPDLLGKTGSEKKFAYSERRLFSQLSGPVYGSTEQYSVQDSRFKLILSEPGRRIELYDLRTDAEETVDLSSELPSDRRRLALALSRWLAETPIAAGDASIPPEKIEALRSLGYL